MATLHQELWRYTDERGVTAVVFRTSPSQGRFVMTRAPVPEDGDVKNPVLLLERTIPLTDDSPTELEDRDWFSLTDCYATGDHHT